MKRHIIIAVIFAILLPLIAGCSSKTDLQQTAPAPATQKVVYNVPVSAEAPTTTTTDPTDTIIDPATPTSVATPTEEPEEITYPSEGPDKFFSRTTAGVQISHPDKELFADFGKEYNNIDHAPFSWGQRTIYMPIRQPGETKADFNGRRNKVMVDNTKEICDTYPLYAAALLQHLGKDIIKAAGYPTGYEEFIAYVANDLDTGSGSIAKWAQDTVISQLDRVDLEKSNFKVIKKGDWYHAMIDPLYPDETQYSHLKGVVERIYDRWVWNIVSVKDGGIKFDCNMLSFYKEVVSVLENGEVETKGLLSMYLDLVHKISSGGDSTTPDPEPKPEEKPKPNGDGGGDTPPKTPGKTGEGPPPGTGNPDDPDNPDEKGTHPGEQTKPVPPSTPPASADDDGDTKTSGDQGEGYSPPPPVESQEPGKSVDNEPVGGNSGGMGGA